jgi:hypothetical protein
MLKQRLIIIGVKLLMVGGTSMNMCGDFMRPTGRYPVGTASTGYKPSLPRSSCTRMVSSASSWTVRKSSSVCFLFSC